MRRQDLTKKTAMTKTNTKKKTMTKTNTKTKTMRNTFRELTQRHKDKDNDKDKYIESTFKERS